jgi:hypothetical protein
MNNEDEVLAPARPWKRLNPFKSHNGEALVLHLQELAPKFHIVWIVVSKIH